MTELVHPEDPKLVTLSRAARARIGAVAGACVRDQDGRTYSGATVTIGTRTFTALEVALSMAVASGATAIEAACVLGAAPSDDDIVLVNQLLQPAGSLIVCAPNGDIVSVTTA